MAYLIGGILIGMTMALTIYNTYLLHRKKETTAAPMTEQEKRVAEDIEAMMNYRGRQ